MIDKALWESGAVVYVEDGETGERLGYVPEHVYDRIVEQLQSKLKTHVALLEEVYRILDDARTRGL